MTQAELERILADHRLWLRGEGGTLADLRCDALQQRIDNALAEMDAIADLLADSEELPVGQTAAVRLLNEAIEALSGLPRDK